MNVNEHEISQEKVILANDVDNDSKNKDPNMPQSDQCASNQTSTKMIMSEEREDDLKGNKKNDKDNNKDKQKGSIWSWFAKKISSWWNCFIEAVKSLLCFGSEKKIDLNTGVPVAP